MLGTLVNVAAILVGVALGCYVVPSFSDGMRQTVTGGVALAVLLIGLNMALGVHNVLVVILSLAAGGAAGEALKIQEKLDRAGSYLQEIAGGGEGSRLAEGFVTATLVYCVGPMAIMGAIQSGLHGDHSTLFAKSMLDGITAVVFSSTMGLGVAGAAGSVFLYQGSITILAAQLAAFLSDAMIADLTAAGGLIIVAIGLNMLEITRLRAANLLPAIFVAPLLVYLAGLVGNVLRLV